MVKKDVPTTEKTADRLYHVAARLFRQHGFAATSTQQIATELGLQKGSLYHHIEKKEQLLHLICVNALLHIQQAVNRALAEVSEPGERLHALVHAHTYTALNEQDEFATALLDRRELSPENQRTIMALHDSYEGTVQGVIADCQTAGIIRCDTPARQLTLLLLSMMNFTTFWFNPDGQLSPDELANLYLQQFLQGATTPVRNDVPQPH